MNRRCFSRRYYPRASISNRDITTQLAGSVSKNVHETTLSAVSAIFDIVSRGVNGSLRVHVNIVGMIVRGLTHASCAHPDIAPLSQEPTQAHADLCRRGLTLENQSKRTVEEESELALLDTSARALDEGKYARGDDVMFFTVVDDHPEEQWLTINVQSTMKKSSNEFTVNDSEYPGAERSVREFVNLLIAEQRVCPYTESAEIAAVGATSLTPAPVQYITNTNTPSCSTLVSSTLKAANEMLQSSMEETSTVLLLLPQFNNFHSFSQSSAYMTDVLTHCGMRKMIDIVLFHPDYERATLNCENELVGHLPPPAQLVSRAIATSRETSTHNWSPHQLAEALDFARRAPVPVVNILRADQLQMLSASNAHGALYVRNAEKLAAIGVDKLRLQLDKWKAISRER